MSSSERVVDGWKKHTLCRDHTTLPQRLIQQLEV